MTDYDVRKSIGVELQIQDALALKTLGKADESVRERQQLIKGDCADEKLGASSLAARQSPLSRRFSSTNANGAAGNVFGRMQQLACGREPEEVGRRRDERLQEAESVLCEMSWNAELAVVNGRENVEKHPGTVVYVYERVG